MVVKKYWLNPLIAATVLTIAITIAMLAPMQNKYDIIDTEYNYTQVSPSSIMLSQKCGPIFAVQVLKGTMMEIPEKFYTTAGKTAEPPSPPGLVPAFGYAAPEGLTVEQITYYPYQENPDLYFSENTILRTMWDNDIIVIWYDPEKISTDDEETFNLLTENTQGQLLIIPWMNYEDVEELPLGRTVAYATVGATLSCEGYNINVLNEFRQYTQENKQHITGSPLEEADLDYSLTLPQIVGDKPEDLE